MALYRRTSDPNVTCPEDLYSSEDLARMDQAAALEDQIDAIDRELPRLDDEFNGADMAGDTLQCGKIEDRAQDLIDLQSSLQWQLHEMFR